MNDNTICPKNHGHPHDYSLREDGSCYLCGYSEDVQAALDLLSAMSDRQRREVFGRFCKYCGGSDPHCYCTNDE